MSRLSPEQWVSQLRERPGQPPTQGAFMDRYQLIALYRVLGGRDDVNGWSDDARCRRLA